MSGVTPSRVVFEKGDFIMQQGDKNPDRAYLIQSGKVEVFTLKNGAKVHIAFAAANDIIGEMALVDNAPRSASVVALQPTVCAAMDKATFQKALQTSNPFIVALLRVITHRYRSVMHDISGSKG